MLAHYKALLEEYRRAIDTRGWWDGPREALAREMDAAWCRMSGAERDGAVAYAEELYRRRLGG